MTEKQSRLKFRLALPCLLLFLLGCTATFRRHEPIFVYSLSPAPAFLTESLALEFAQKTLALEGYDPAAWRPINISYRKAPDGKREQLLDRWDSNNGKVIFRHKEEIRTYSLVLKGDQLLCTIIHGL